LNALHAAIAQDPAPDFGSFEASAFHLYLSQTGPGGTVYTSLAEFPL
jgi:2'-5' RNA ligase